MNLYYVVLKGQKLTTKSSLFEDPNNGKFALQENSELRGKGDATPFMAAGNDLGLICVKELQFEV